MKKLALLAVPAVAFVGTLGMGSRTARADHVYFAHIHELAEQLDYLRQGLEYELYYNYRHTPEYQHLMADVREMAELTAHIHELTHDPYAFEHLRHDVMELDELFHHIEMIVDGMARAGMPAQPGFSFQFGGNGYSFGYGFGGGDSHGFNDHGPYGGLQRPYNLRRIRSILHRIDLVLHHLAEDLGI